MVSFQNCASLGLVARVAIMDAIKELYILVQSNFAFSGQ